MTNIFTIVLSLFLTTTLFPQIPDKANKKMGQYPAIFLDSADTEMSVLNTLNPFDISNIDLVYPKKAKKLLGAKGKDGAVYITTVKSAKASYWNYFRTKSSDYKLLLNTPQSDTMVQYMLNGELLTDSAAPGILFTISDKNFKSLKIIDKEQLSSDPVYPKRYVVAITAKKQKGFVKRKSSK